MQSRSRSRSLQEPFFQVSEKPSRFPVTLLILCSLACSGPRESAPSGPGDDGRPPDATLLDLSLTAVDAADVTALESELAELESLTESELLNRHHVPFGALDYDPLAAENLELIQRSSLALGDAGLGVLAERGFVITREHEFPTFVYGYTMIYSEDLPVYVSADSILNAVHRSYSDILRTLEEESLIPELRALLTGLRSQLGSVADIKVRADLDTYLTVAASLLQGEVSSPQHGGDTELIKRILERAHGASGLHNTRLFGVPRVVDFSQFKPRGHYTKSVALERYFRAMIWLGRVDFRLIETQPDGSQIFYRSQLDATLALGTLVSGALLQHFERIDRTIEAFVGESDYMTLPEVADLITALGGLEAIFALSDAEAAQAIIDGGWGAQRIASHFVVNDGSVATLPLNRSFALLGQRYVLDSHVFSNVTWDRTEAKRMLPDPLDVAFAALGNDQGAELLEPQLTHYGYAPNLAKVRALADRHDASFWDKNLYNLWLSALRALSPTESVAAPHEVGLPQIAGTEAWGRRLLNTQLSSWAELRHDTLLYAKQSYTASVACEFPDAYVDPYPELYGALQRFAEKGSEITTLLSGSAQGTTLGRVAAYFGELHRVASLLREMAEHQRSGTPFTQEHMDFINDTVGFFEGGCAPEGSTGWYARLFFNQRTSSDYDPVIADVHTQPTDEVGNVVGHVLHVGTGRARLLVVTADTCSGPRAYVGLAASYHELVTRDFERLDDAAWQKRLAIDPPSDVPWLAPVLAE